MGIWNDRNTGYVIRNYSVIPTAQIAQKLKLKPSQINSKVKDLRAAGHQIPMIKKRWSAAEHEYLKRNYTKYPTAEIAKHLNKTPIEITSMVGIFRKKGIEIGEKPSRLCRGKARKK